MGKLLLARDGHKHPVGLQPPRQLLQYGARPGCRLGRKNTHHTIAGSLETEGVFGERALDVEEAVLVGFIDQAAGRGQVDKLGADGGSHDHQFAALAVHDDGQGVTRNQSTRVGEFFRHDDLVEPVIGEGAARPHDQPVDDRRGTVRHGYHQPANGFGNPGHVAQNFVLNARMDLGNPGQVCLPHDLFYGRLLKVDPEICHAAGGVVRDLGRCQVARRGQHADIAGDAERDDRRDRQQHLPRVPQVADQLAIQGVHQSRSLGARGLSFS